MIGAVGRVGLLGLQSGRHGRLLLYPAYVQDYLDRVTAADVSAGNTQGLELGVTDAFNTCLQAMVGDGSLGVSGNVLAQAASLVKASCAMQGARTLSGALVPLAADMPAPTNFNFVAGDYNRRTGLGDPNNVSKYLDVNRNNNSDAQDNRHGAVYASQISYITGSNTAYFGASSQGAGGFAIWTSGSTSTAAATNINNVTGSGVFSINYPGLIGVSRSNASSYTVRGNNTNTVVSISSAAPVTSSVFVFRPVFSYPYNNGRLGFYSFGSALDLTILDARITALSTAIQAAIAP